MHAVAVFALALGSDVSSDFFARAQRHGVDAGKVQKANVRCEMLVAQELTLWGVFFGGRVGDGGSGWNSESKKLVGKVESSQEVLSRHFFPRRTTELPPVPRLRAATRLGNQSDNNGVCTVCTPDLPRSTQTSTSSTSCTRVRHRISLSLYTSQKKTCIFPLICALPAVQSFIFLFLALRKPKIEGNKFQKCLTSPHSSSSSSPSHTP